MSKWDELISLISKPGQYQYFFRTVDNPDLFDGLDQKLHCFDKIPEPEIQDDDKHVSFPRWWPGQYLIKVADRIPDKVGNVLKRIKTDNPSVIDDAMHALLNMPTSVSKNYVALVGDWFDSKFQGRLVAHRAFDLFHKLMENKEYEASFELLKVFLAVIKEDKNKLKFRCDEYYVHRVVEKEAGRLIPQMSNQILEYAENSLRRILKGELKDDASSNFEASNLWRPTIEDAGVRYDNDSPKNVLFDLILGATIYVSKNENEASRERIKRYLEEEKFLIFRRLALYVLAVSNGFQEIKRDLLSEKSLIHDEKIRNEYLYFVTNAFDLLPDDAKETFLKDVMSGPAEREGGEPLTDMQRECWVLRKLHALLPIISNRTDLKATYELLAEKYKEYPPKFPDLFMSVSTGWVGPESPLGKKELAAMSPEEFLNYITVEFKPNKVHWEPSPEGLSRILEEVVQDKPEAYAEAADKFFDPDNIYPAYPTGVLRGLQKAAQESKQFPLDSVFVLCESLIGEIKNAPDVKGESRRGDFDFGQFSWARGVIGNLFEAITTNDKFSIDQNEMVRVRALLFRVLKEDPDPTEEDEKAHGGDNMGFISYCINCNRGKSIYALLSHALRWARTFRPEAERLAEKDKGPFPPGGSRFEPETKEFLTAFLATERSPSVQAALGHYLPQLYFLDQEWVCDQKEKGLFLPSSSEQTLFWQAHMVSYVSYGTYYDELYRFLKVDFKRLIDELDQGNCPKDERFHIRHRLGEFLMIAFWKALDGLEKQGVISEFFDKSEEKARGHAIAFLARICKDNNLETFPPERWPVFRSLWEKRLRQENSEVANFVRWLPYVPEPIGKIKNLIHPTIPFLHLEYQEEDLLKYINQHVNQDPASSLELLKALFEIRESLANMHFRESTIKEILVKAASKPKDSPAYQLLEEVVNKLGELGYYDYREILA
jgi:hypothetical protein